jgi:UDP-glucose 4-epimerase
MTDIIVTGAAGMVGTDLMNSLLDDGYDVVGVDITENRWDERVADHTVIADLRKPDDLRVLPTDADMIVHLAANARVHNLVKLPKGARDNFEMTYNVLEFARKNDVGRFLFGSSREVYGNKGKLIYNERDTHIDECESPYTASKVGGEAMLKAYERCYDLQSTILRFSNVYGRYDLSDRVLPLFIAQATEGQDLTVFGGDKILDFTYLDDCVAGIHGTITNFPKAQGTTFNIASGVGTSLVELAETIIAELDADSNIHVKSSRTGEIRRYVADIAKAKKILGYQPEVGFEAGMMRTIEWYTSNESYLEEIRRKS